MAKQDEKVKQEKIMQKKQYYIDLQADITAKQEVRDREKQVKRDQQMSRLADQKRIEDYFEQERSMQLQEKQHLGKINRQQLLEASNKAKESHE